MSCYMVHALRAVMEAPSWQSRYKNSCLNSVLPSIYTDQSLLPSHCCYRMEGGAGSRMKQQTDRQYKQRNATGPMLSIIVSRVVLDQSICALLRVHIPRAKDTYQECKPSSLPDKSQCFNIQLPQSPVPAQTSRTASEPTPGPFLCRLK